MILVDTSVWVDHLRIGIPALAELLLQEQVLIHPFVIGELACGNIQNRREVLSLLHNLPLISVASEQEVLLLVESRSLMGRGVGYIDMHLLASVLIRNGSKLWTRDKRLIAITSEMNLSLEPPTA
ncbi:type II toxin-antitoxin system VapC family toxin [cf. Phormidesmis sp. LEGE 11477]|uniref:type II toxin-antitoxin system VapC family toxin n=1 Tax=cf. Phormidesmis sp. LEGE 11477 TaxID=1828680 RepID=UPI001881C516|nr:type II toxin-antitoxin system VapC family toxin [cf. Phormidesmis sp. LEGE 11477]MBE9060925.1 type II toxin-antitoxin system VapC family toxin [cf. Phormidesmis sp. LEGE 11477]